MRSVFNVTDILFMSQTPTEIVVLASYEADYEGHECGCYVNGC